ncbi:nucleoid occlusion protein [Pontibacillus salicampi]|uniref:Nucleoid occlusion protein n=1 Tax=Pontibacillus salicampi TaxID=1449801 RepID=A0ABV6LUP8_9BACI
MKHPFSRLFGLGDKSDAKAEDQDEQQQEQEYHPDEVVQIPIEQIQPNRYQPRTFFNEEKIEELAQTIHTHGMIQPIVVRKIEDDEGYELIAGERRWRAVHVLGWKEIPAILRDMDDTQTASVALIENLQREELSVVEEAAAYAKLLEIHGLTQEALAQRLGKSQSTIANKLRLLKLPESVRQAIMDKQITERHARALIALKEQEAQEKLLEEIIQKSLNVKQTEQRVDKLLNQEKETKKKKPKMKGISKDMRIAMNTIRQSVSMVSDTGIDLETDEEDYDEYYQITIKIPKNKS